MKKFQKLLDILGGLGYNGNHRKDSDPPKIEDLTMHTYVVIGYTKTGLYSENVEATSALVALAKGKKLIMDWMPAKRWQFWRVVPY